jgi:hypothetical protein
MNERLLVIQRLVAELLVVVETTLARLVIALATRRTATLATRRALVTGRRLEASGRRSAGEICTTVAHRAAIARRRCAAIATATATSAAATIAAATTIAAASAAAIATATAATIAAAATTAVAATSAAAIATATAATITATTTAVGRTRAAATAAAAAKSTTTAATTGLALDGFTHRDRATVEQRAVHGLHRGSTHFIGFHLEEGEAAAAAGLAIHDHFRRGDIPELGEGFLQTLGRDGVGQIAHKQFTTHSRLWAGGIIERSPGRAAGRLRPSDSLTFDG